MKVDHFISAGNSVILDINLGWNFQWEKLDSIAAKHPATCFLPIILECSHETCIERIRKRHNSKADYYDPPEIYLEQEKIRKIWRFLAELARPDLLRIDAEKDQETTYQDLRRIIEEKMGAVKA